MHPAQAFLQSFLLTSVGLGAFTVLISLPLGYPSGDLARSGALPESEWEARQEQPQSALAPNQVAIEDADVLILGDSFSRPLIWQGEFERLTHKTTLTFHYGEVLNANHWLKFLLQRKLKPGSTIIIEVIERSFMDTLLNLPQQVQGLNVPEHPGGKWAPIKPLPRYWINADLIYDLTVWLHIFQDRGPKEVVSGITCETPLKTSTLFSNRRSDWLLYGTFDDATNEWTSDQVAQVMTNLEVTRQKFATRGVKFLIMMIPDKGTIYRPYFKFPKPCNETVNQALMEHQFSPFNLIQALRDGTKTTVDLYLPDETHLGNNGYRLLGQTVAKAFPLGNN